MKFQFITALSLFVSAAGFAAPKPAAPDSEAAMISASVESTAPQVTTVNSTFNTSGLSLIATPAISSAVTADTPKYAGKWHVAARTGSDESFFHDRPNTYHNGNGVELGYVFAPTINHMYVELGTLLTTYYTSQSQAVNSMHIAPMLGYETRGFVFGGRILAGAVQRYDDHHGFGDFGAEARIGKEWKKATLFLSGGRTDHLSRVGVDVGYLF